LNRLLRTDTQSVGVFYPYKGSPIRDMMVRDGLISDDFDLSNLIDYNFTTFTSGNRSVVHFKDMDSKEVNNLRVLFSSYCFWPIQLFPLIDYVRKNQNPFVTSLFNGIQNVTYHKKYGDWPSHIVKLNEDHLLNKDIVSMIESFEDSEVKEFAELLIVQWSEDGLDKLVGFLKAIQHKDLEPDVKIPKETEDLMRWLDIKIGDKDSNRKLRLDLRKIAQDNTKIYSNS